MNKIFLLFSITIILISCNSKHQIVSKKEKDRIEIFEYKNFTGERIEDYSDIAITRKFYKNNRLVKVKYFDLNDEPVKNRDKWDTKNAEWVFEYDNKGNFIRQIAYDSKGNIVDMEGYWNSAIKEYSYNEKNQLIKVSQYNKSMELVELGDFRNAITKFGYNEKNQLIWQKSYYANKELINNGFGYSKYEYNEDGSINKHIYLFEEGMIEQFTLFTYQKDTLIKKEDFNNKNERISSVEYIYEKNRLKKIKFINAKGEISFKEERVLVKIKGWKISDDDKKKLRFNVLNENGGTTGGKYNFTINTKGKILNIKEFDFNGGVPKFNMDVYQKFKQIKFVKTNSNNIEFEGKIEINVLRQQNDFHIGLGLEEILKPVPSMY